MPAAVQFGTIATAPIKAPKMVVVLLPATSLSSLVGFTVIPQLVRSLPKVGEGFPVAS